MNIPIIKGLADYFTPVLGTSQFFEKGVLTPEEFVRAGDEFVAKCPTWHWSGGDAAYTKAYLPKDKQFLIAKNVPSFKRANALTTSEAVVEQQGDDAEGWLSTDTDRPREEVKDISSEVPSPTASAGLDGATQQLGTIKIDTDYIPKPAKAEAEDVPDLESFEEENLAEPEPVKQPEPVQSPAEAVDDILKASEPEEDTVRTRTYDISIVYDKYYQTPRVYLFGYNEYSQPLSSNDIMEDISGDHANKTVTVENHPHNGIAHLSIHPCKHANVMKRLVDQMQLEYDAKTPAKSSSASAVAAPADKDKPKLRFNVDQYLFLFLKFISSVIPTIDYDYTVSI